MVSRQMIRCCLVLILLCIEDSIRVTRPLPLWGLAYNHDTKGQLCNSINVCAKLMYVKINTKDCLKNYMSMTQELFLSI